MKRKKRCFALGMAFWLFFSVSGCAKASRETEVVVFRIGKADAILLLSGQNAALIDAGEEEDGEEILRFLSTRGINALDLMIITHYDKDHVGGADAVLAGIPVRAVYDADDEADSERYRAYVEALKAVGAPRHRVSRKTTLKMGDWSLTLRPTALREVSDNDRSLVVEAENSWHRFFFAADAEEARILELLAEGLERADVVKMPHHGKYHASLPDFLEALGAKTAVITDSEKNPARKETLLLLGRMNIDTYQTKNGNVHIRSGEAGLTVHQ